MTDRRINKTKLTSIDIFGKLVSPGLGTCTYIIGIRRKKIPIETERCLPVQQDIIKKKTLYKIHANELFLRSRNLSMTKYISAIKTLPERNQRV